MARPVVPPLQVERWGPNRTRDRALRLATLAAALIEHLEEEAAIYPTWSAQHKRSRARAAVLRGWL